MLTRKYVYSSLCFVIFLFLFAAASGPDSLAVKSNVVTYVRSRDAVISGSGRRWRRSMSQREMDESTSIHNNLRRREGAADMEYMKWNCYLASMAQDWADGCNFVHGQPNRDPSTKPYDPIGQNLHATTGRLNITSAIEAGWYNEKQFYDYNSNNCEPNKMCGHYTQVVWASSREIGCAVSRCPILRSTNFGKNPASYLVCNYGPAGNYEGQKPFKKGRTCTGCRGGVKWCNEGLCYMANETEPLTCASPPSLPHSNQAKSLSFIIAIMTLATMTSLTMWTMDLLR